MSDQGRPIDELREKDAGSLSASDYLLGHDAGNPAGFRVAVGAIAGAVLGAEWPSDVPFYETGVFTPELSDSSLSAGFTHSTQVGSFIRVGELVVASVDLTVTARSSGSPGIPSLVGLPYAPKSNGDVAPVFITNFLATGNLEHPTVLVGNVYGRWSVLGYKATGDDGRLWTSDIQYPMQLRATLSYAADVPGLSP